jgi:hypothetical protein
MYGEVIVIDCDNEGLLTSIPVEHCMFDLTLCESKLVYTVTAEYVVPLPSPLLYGSGGRHGTPSQKFHTLLADTCKLSQ